MIIAERPADPELAQSLDKFRRNGEWLTKHGSGLFDRYRGKYIAVSGGEVFAADDACEAERLAEAKHPDDEPFVQWVPRDRCPRIYAC
jgi:hypothetical protein